MFKKLKDVFTDDAQDTDLSRRRFISSAAALAALTVVGSVAPSLLKTKEIQEQIATGRLYGQTFYINEPVVINIPNILIEDCKFIAIAPMKYMFLVQDSKVHIMNCHLETNGLVGNLQSNIDWS